MDPYRRLAAAVMLKAIEDYQFYHSDLARKYRRDRAKVLIQHGTQAAPHEWAKRGWDIRKAIFVKLTWLHENPDPYEFLTTDTPYHAILGIDLEEFTEHIDDPEWVEETVKKIRHIRRFWTNHWDGRKTTNKGGYHPASQANLKQNR